jgi:hypothetical protein
VDEWLSFIASLPEATRQRIATATQEQAARDNMASMRRLVPEGGRTAMEPEYPLTSAMGSILGSVKDAATLPGRALYGEVPRADEMPQGEAVGEALNMAGMVSLPALRGGRAANTVSMSGASDGPGIKAYHGSPHDFDRFSLDKIGTGEGAQAYGHGLYFAENEGVARGYRDALKGRNFDLEKYAQSVGVDIDDSARYELVRKASSDASTADAAKHAQWSASSLRGYDRASLEKIIDAYRAANKGHMYEVNIKATPDDLLDWDAPLSQQPAKVQEFFKKRAEELKNTSGRDVISDDTTGDILYRAAHPQGGEDIDWTRPLGKQATDKMKDSGILGLRYLDQGSRGAGDGSRNIVAFDDSVIEILRKYGLLGPLGLGAGAAAVGTNDGT